MSNFTGVIIEESLKDKKVLDDIEIVKTKVEKVTKEHKTPWLKQWTLDDVVIPEKDADKIANSLSGSLDNNYWYADFKDEKTHYIIFPNKVFKIDRSKPEGYKAATEYGVGLGIPDYQLDFSPHIKEWERER